LGFDAESELFVEELDDAVSLFLASDASDFVDSPPSAFSFVARLPPLP
jgi:hypothetical protein